MSKTFHDDSLQSWSDDINNAIIQSEQLFPITIGSDDILKKILFSSPVPAFLFKKIDEKIILTDFSMAASSLISKNKSSSLVRDTEAAISFFTDKPEILSDVARGFSEKSSFNREISYNQQNSVQYQCFRLTYTLLNATLLIVYVEQISKDNLIVSELRRKHERLEMAIGATELGLWEWNIASGDLLINDKWATMLDYNPNSINKHIVTWKNLLHPEDQSRVINTLSLHIKGDSDKYQSEHRLLKKNGDCIWVLDTGKIMARDPKGYPVRAIGTKIDISERKIMEEKLYRKNQNLAKEVKEKNRELLNKELQLRKYLEKSKKQSSRIEALNNALKKIVKRDNSQVQEHVKANINEIIIPYLDNIENNRDYSGQRVYIDIIRSNLNNILSPISSQLHSLNQALTPTEVRVSDLIRHGKSTKEISDLMFVSTKTVKTHRRNIRKKLSLNGKKINLISYFRSIQ